MTTKTSAYTVDAFRTQLKELGRRVKVARQSKGMTQEELATLIGISSKSVSAIETGRIEASIAQMQAIAAVLEEPMGYFTGESISMVESKMDRVAAELEAIRKAMELARLRG